MDTYESVILVKNEVFVFKIPPRTSNRGYRAADWNLQEPQWTGRMRLVVKNNELVMKLEDKASGELFAKSPIETYPGVALESVTDSSRYFVVRVQDDNGRAAFIGIGFGDRSDSFDLNVALQDHFKWLRKEKQGDDGKPQQEMDFSFKEGETIKINMKITKKGDGESSRVKPRSVTGAGGGLLPPPPGARLPPPPSPQHATAPTVPSDADALSAPTNTADWGDFSSAGGQPTGQPQNSPANSNWVQF